MAIFEQSYLRRKDQCQLKENCRKFLLLLLSLLLLFKTRPREEIEKVKHVQRNEAEEEDEEETEDELGGPDDDIHFAACLGADLEVCRGLSH